LSVIVRFTFFFSDLVEAEITKRLEKVAQRIVLDVGGQRFATSRETLLRIPDTYFTALLGHDQWLPEADGSYFIDRNPIGFQQFLHYLRTGELFLDSFDPEMIHLLFSHFSYFLVPLPSPLGETLWTKQHWNCDFSSLKVYGNMLYLPLGGAVDEVCTLTSQPLNSFTGLLSVASMAIRIVRMIPRDPENLSIRIGLMWKDAATKFEEIASLQVATSWLRTFTHRTNFFNAAQPLPTFKKINEGSIFEVSFNFIRSSVCFGIDGERKFAYTVSSPLFPLETGGSRVRLRSLNLSLNVQVLDSSFLR